MAEEARVLGLLNLNTIFSHFDSKKAMNTLYEGAFVIETFDKFMEKLVSHLSFQNRLSIGSQQLAERAVRLYKNKYEDGIKKDLILTAEGYKTLINRAKEKIDKEDEAAANVNVRAIERN